MEQPVLVIPDTNPEKLQQAQAKQEEPIQVIVSLAQQMFLLIAEVQVNIRVKEDQAAAVVVLTALLVQVLNHLIRDLLHPVVATGAEVANTEDLHLHQALALDILLVDPVAVAAVVALIRQVVVLVAADQAIHQVVAPLVQVQPEEEDKWTFTIFSR